MEPGWILTTLGFAIIFLTVAISREEGDPKK